MDGLPLLSQAGLIPFKAKAYLDLADRRAKGEPIDGNDVRKHRNDVFRLLQLLGGGEAIALPDVVRTNMLEFVVGMQADESLEPKAFGVRMSAGQAVHRLVAAFRAAVAMNELAESKASQVVAANSALELAAESLAMFAERPPDAGLARLAA